MPWKCVLVGLALVLPGFLLIVEGRHGAAKRDVDQDDAIISKILKSVREDINGQDQLTEVAEEQQVINEQNSADSGRTRGKDSGVASTSTEEKKASGIMLQAQAAPLTSHDASVSGQTGIGLAGSNIVFIMIVAGCTVLAAVGIVGAGVCWYKYNRRTKAAGVVEYPAYGVTGPTKDHLPSPGDRKLAQSAQMYHYQHQKQQMIAMEKANGNMKHDASDDESEEDNVEGDYTVYECPGLAPTGEMEVKNPLFRGDETPTAPPDEDSQPPQQDN
nr:neural proliferation differentiation and control domain-containing protein [Crepidula fornicata]